MHSICRYNGGTLYAAIKDALYAAVKEALYAAIKEALYAAIKEALNAAIKEALSVICILTSAITVPFCSKSIH